MVTSSGGPLACIAHSTSRATASGEIGATAAGLGAVIREWIAYLPEILPIMRELHDGRGRSSDRTVESTQTLLSPAAST